MTVILQDPVFERDPTARHAFPDPAIGTKARSVLEHTRDQGNLAVITPSATSAQRVGTENRAPGRSPGRSTS